MFLQNDLTYSKSKQLISCGGVEPKVESSVDWFYGLSDTPIKSMLGFGRHSSSLKSKHKKRKPIN